MKKLSARIAVWLCFVAAAGCTQQYCYFVGPARLEESPLPTRRNGGGGGCWYSMEAQRLLVGHHVISGDRLVLLIRRYDPGYIFRLDDEEFEKLSIEIPLDMVGREVRLPDRRVRTYYSRGSAAFARLGAGVYGVAAQGSLCVSYQSSSQLRMRVSVDIQLIAATEGEASDSVSLSGTYQLQQLALSNVSNWVGKTGPVECEVSPYCSDHESCQR
jgi:hypothetical protein